MGLKQKIIKLFGRTDTTQSSHNWNEFIDKYYIWGVMGLGILIWMLAPVIWGQHSDNRENQRREHFNKNFEIFAKLEEMQRQDENVFSISIEHFESFKETEKNACSMYKYNNVEHEFCYEFEGNQGLSHERFSEYKELLNQANLHQLIYQYDQPKKRQVWFNEEGQNDSGYVYMEYPPSKVFNSFKECKPIMPSQSCYILLRKNWYLYSEQFRLEQDNAK